MEDTMKKSLSLLAVLAVVGFASTPVQAADHYVSGMAGISWMQDSSIDLPLNLNEVFGVGIDLGYSSGFTAVGAVGCDYGSTRLEAEVGYQTNDIDSITGSFDGDSASLALSGNAKVLSLMANGFYDFDLGGVELYAMAGIGVAQVSINDLTLADTNDLGISADDIDDANEYLSRRLGAPVDLNALGLNVNETTLAYQVGAGLAVPIGDGIMFDARYRYFATTDFTMPLDLNTNISSHSALLGLRVNL